MYCTSGTECLSRTPGSHSVCAVRTPLGVDRKILSIRKEPMLSGLLTLNTAGCATEAFSTTCAVHIEDCGGWWLSGCCGSVAEHWRLKPEVSWVRLPATAGFFTFLYFRLITSKFIYFQREARCSEHWEVGIIPKEVLLMGCSSSLSLELNLFSCLRQCWKPLKPAAIDR